MGALSLDENKKTNIFEEHIPARIDGQSKPGRNPFRVDEDAGRLDPE
jgi:hypothetical protein